jgi:uncharacterized CHY-type Zn-finger protein
MLKRFRDFEHLIRMAGLFAIGTLTLLALRGVLVPSDFGRFGHFRARALADNAAQELKYAGHELCESCHEEIVEVRSTSAHRPVNCESCHGPLSEHAADPSTQPVALPRAEYLCSDCHQENASRPDWFPQVDVQEHAEAQSCVSCHDPHDPGYE